MVGPRLSRIPTLPWPRLCWCCTDPTLVPLLSNQCRLDLCPEVSSGSKGSQTRLVLEITRAVLACHGGIPVIGVLFVGRRVVLGVI